MITKVKNLKNSMEMAGNFEHDPGATTGLDFGHFGGFCLNSGELQEISAGTVTVPDNVTSTVYIDSENSPIVLVAEVSITSERYIPLYTVVAGGGTISTVTDLRSVTSSSVGTTLGAGSINSVIEALNPIVWFKMDETSGLPVNSGSGAGWDMTLQSGTPTYQITSGDQSQVGKAIGFDGSTDAFLAAIATSTFEGLDSSSSGAIIFIFRTPDIPVSGRFVAWSNKLDSGFREPHIGHSTDKIQFSWAGPTQVAYTITSTTDVDDDEWHVLIINHDGTDSDLWLDGVKEADTSSGMDKGRWFDDDPPSSQFDALAFSGAAFVNESGTTGKIEFDMDHLIVVDGFMTDQEIADLTNSYFGT